MGLTRPAVAGAPLATPRTVPDHVAARGGGAILRQPWVGWQIPRRGVDWELPAGGVAPKAGPARPPGGVVGVVRTPAGELKPMQRWVLSAMVPRQ